MHLCQGRGSSDPCISSKASGGRVREPMQSMNDSWCFNNFLVLFSNVFLCFHGRWNALKVLCCKTWIVVFLHSFSDKKNVHPGPETLATPTRRYCKGWYISQFASHWNFMILIPPPWNSRIDTQNDAIFERGDTPINPIIFCVYFFRVFQGCIRWVQENTCCTFTTEPLIADTNKHQVDRNFTVGVFISNPTPIGVRFAYTFRSN